MQFDDVLTCYVGDWGRGQLVLLLASSSSWITLSLIVLSMVFVTQKPKWDCLSTADTMCLLVLQQQGDLCDLSHDQYTWTSPHTSVVSSFNLVCGEGWKVGLSNAVFFIGYWVGSSLFGWVADKRGRKKCLLLSNLTSAVAAVLCGMSPGYWWYVAARTAVGCCCSGLPVASYVLATEAVGPSYRGRAGTYSQVVYHVGEWLLPFLAFWLQDWRSLNWAIAGWCLITAAVVLPYPESPRWLLLHGREQEARTALMWLAEMNGRQLPTDLVVSAAKSSTKVELCTADTVLTTADDTEEAAPPTALAPTQHQAAITGCKCDGVALLQHQPGGVTACATAQGSAGAAWPDHHSEGLFSIFHHPLLLRYFLVTMLLCLAMATTFYLANLATDNLGGSLYNNFLLTSVGELPAALVAAVAVDYVGRKVTIGTGLWLTGIACGACSLLPSGWWTTALASVGKAACSGTWTIAYIHAAELFPTSIRSAALAGTNQASRLGGVLAPAIIYLSDKLHSAALPFAVAGVVSLLTGALLNKLPETMGMQQPETSLDLERMYGQQAACTTNACCSSQVMATPAGDVHSNPQSQQWFKCQSFKLRCLLSRCVSNSSAGRWISLVDNPSSSSPTHTWEMLNTVEHASTAGQDQGCLAFACEGGEHEMELGALLPSKG